MPFSGGKSALDMLGQGGGLLAVVGTACALLWGRLGWRLGKQADESNAKSSDYAAGHSDAKLAGGTGGRLEIL